MFPIWNCLEFFRSDVGSNPGAPRERQEPAAPPPNLEVSRSFVARPPNLRILRLSGARGFGARGPGARGSGAK